MKKFLLFIILLSVSFASYADRVRSSVAENVAKTMLPKAELKELSHQTNFSNFYIFSSDNGFVIVAADDRAFPVIAYSDKNPFKVEDMSENVYSWLKSVDKGIQNIADSKGVASEEVKAEWKSFSKGKKPAEKYRSTVEPLVTTTWGQDYPYNDSCPIPWGGEDRTVVGCVATAMAQIMNYWEWPHRGVGEKSYSPSRPIGILTANFGETEYDWDNMRDDFWIYNVEDSTWTYEYWSKEEVDAVATLMFHCGVSVSMSYGVDVSGAYSEDVVRALKNYFNYDPNLQLVYKSNYTDTEWKDLLKSELNAGRPVYYAGDDNVSGHAFVCDGYDANGYFHFNWGWDGYCDGYYLIGDLEPGIGGTGAGNGSYNNNNEIVIGIQPNPATLISIPDPPTNLAAEVDFPNVTITWSEVAEAVSYKLYRNGKLVARVTDNYYTDFAPGQHTYYVRSVSADGVNSVNSETLDVEVLYEGPKITDLKAKRYNVNNVELNWTSDVVENATLKYYDGDFQGWYTGMSPTFYWGHRFTKEELTEYASMSITSVDVIVCEDEQYELAVFTEEDNVLEKVYSQEFTCPSGSYEKWFTVTLDTPVLLDYTKNVLIMLKCPSGDESGVSLPVAVDESVNFGKNARVMYDGVHFYEMADTDTWFIRTHIVSANTYDVYRNGEEIASEIAETSYKDTDLELGTYEYSVRANYSGGVTEPKTVVIELGEPEEYTLTLSVDSEEKGSVEGGGKYLESTIVTAKATPKYGYELKEWTENGTQVSTDVAYTFEIEGDRNLVANFVENNLLIEVVGTTSPTYMGASDGKIEVKAKSGTAPYIYELGSDKSEPINTSYTFENLAAGNYTVKVTDATGFSVTEIVVLEGSGGLSPPTNVKAVANGTSITLSWDSVEGAWVYGIFYEGEFLVMVYENFAELEGLEPNYTYCYTVVALAEFDDGGYPTKYSDESEEACATTSSDDGGDDAEIPAPSNVKAVATSSTTIRLSWDAVDGALAYGIFYDGEYLGVVYENFAEFEELEPNYTYCFTVMTITGVDSEGYITEYSDESEEACATTSSDDGGDDAEIPAPSNVKAVATSSTTIRLSWDAVDGALAYGIFYEGEYIGVVYENFAEFEELEPNYTYCFTVMTIAGVDSEGYITEYSDESEEACATPTTDGVEELVSAFDIYPNPVEDKLFLATEIEIEEVTIYDIYGRQQVVSYQPSAVSSIDVAGLEAGVYLMKIVTNQGEVVKRFVKK